MTGDDDPRRPIERRAGDDGVSVSMDLEVTRSAQARDDGVGDGRLNSIELAPRSRNTSGAGAESVMRPSLDADAVEGGRGGRVGRLDA
jgi:hypothetical protein